MREFLAAFASGTWLAQAAIPESITIGGIAAALLLFFLNRFGKLLDEQRQDRIKSEERAEKTVLMLAGVIKESTEAKVAMTSSTDRLERTIEGLARNLTPAGHPGEQWRERP